MRVFCHASDSVVAEAKGMLITVVGQIRLSAEARMAASATALASLHAVVQPVLDAIQSVSSAWCEKQAVDIPMVAPVPRVLGKRTLVHQLPDGRETHEVVEDVMFDQPFERTLQTWLQYDENALRDVLSSNARWCQKHTADEADSLANFRIVDVSDSQGFKRHAAWKELWRAGAPHQMFVAFYGDGATISNPIAVFRNNSRVDLFYWALLCLDASHRLSMGNIQLASICKNEDLKRYGSALVLSAAAPEGSSELSTSFGAAMDRMSRGHAFSIPNPTARGLTAGADREAFARLFAQVWCIMMLADSPAAAELFCFKQSFGPATKCPCRLCLACQVDPNPRFYSLLPYGLDL